MIILKDLMLLSNSLLECGIESRKVSSTYAAGMAAAYVDASKKINALILKKLDEEYRKNEDEALAR